MPVATAKKPMTDTTKTVPRAHDELWKECEEKNKALPKSAKWLYMPRFAIVIKPELTPRSKLDMEAVEDYRLHPQEDFPPILVQAGTHALIDGHHRIESWSSFDVIRVTEADIPDEELVDRALTENLLHGVRLTRKDFLRAAAAFLARHKEWTDVRLAEALRVDRGTLKTWRMQKGIADETRTRSDGKQLPVAGYRKRKEHAGFPHAAEGEDEDGEALILRRHFGTIIGAMDLLLELDPEELAAALEPPQLKTLDEKVFYLAEIVKQLTVALRQARVRQDDLVTSQDEPGGTQEAEAEGEDEEDGWTEPVDPSMQELKEDEGELPFD